MLGLESEVLVSAPNWMNFRADINLDLAATSSRIGKLYRLARAFLSARGRYDVFHFNYGSSLIHYPHLHMNQAELPFYPRKAGLLVTYNGCDARQKYQTMQRARIAACHNPNCYGGQCNSGVLDRYRREGIAKMSRYVGHMWAVNPDLLYFLPREKSSFLPYAVINEGLQRRPPRLTARRLKVVHAPTDREAKGTHHVTAAVQRIHRTHPGAIEYEVIEGMTHTEALRKYNDADVVIDQVLIGWYGAFAVELMNMGKPVIARIATEELQLVPDAMAREVTEAFINATPDTLYDTLLRCIEDRDFLARHAQAGEAYANRWHEPRYVAGLTKQRYEEMLG